jgi:intracellular multiplication protein IcmO
MSIASLYKAKIGGTKDTTAIAAMGVGAVLSSPAFADSTGYGSLLLALAGSAHLARRFLAPWEEANILASKLSLKSADMLSSPDGLLLGYRTDTGDPVHIPDEDLMRHGLIGGQSGVGKTVLGKLMMYQQIQRGGGLAFVDGKLDSSAIQEIWEFCVLCGREQDLLILNPGNPELSHSYNPILRGDPDEIAARILSLIPSTENNPGADHYRQSANQGLTTLVAALQEAGLAFNFIDLTILLMNHKAIEELETRLKRTRGGRPATKSLSLFLEQYKGGGKPGSGLENMVDVKRMKETFGGVGGRMFQFGTGKFGEVLNTYSPEIDLFEAIRQNKIIYVALPTMGKNEAASSLGKMFIGDLRTAISWVQALPEDQKPRYPFLAFMDELGSYGVSSLARPFEQARSARFALWPAFQTIANLEVVSPDFAQMVLGNTWTKVFFKVGTQDTADVFADLIGKSISVARSLSQTSNRSENNPMLAVAPEGGEGQGAGISEGEREEEKHRVSPEDLKALDKGECIVLYGGDSVFNIRVPMISVDKKVAREIGPVRIHHKRSRQVEGADYFKNSDRYLGGNSVPTGQRKQTVAESLENE